MDVYIYVYAKGKKRYIFRTNITFVSGLLRAAEYNINTLTYKKCDVVRNAAKYDQTLHQFETIRSCFQVDSIVNIVVRRPTT